MVGRWGWHPEVEMKAVRVQSEKSCLRMKGGEVNNGRPETGADPELEL